MVSAVPNIHLCATLDSATWFFAVGEVPTYTASERLCSPGEGLIAFETAFSAFLVNLGATIPAVVGA